MENAPQGLSYRWARLLARALRRQGLGEAVVIPGSRSTPLVVALEDEGVHLVSVHDERVGGFFALGLARARRKPVAVVTTSGSAGGHLLPAVMEAHESGVPLLLLTADRPPHLVGSGASQTTDQTRFWEGHLNARFLLPPPESIPPEALIRMALQAWRAAMSGPRPGPVHLNVPLVKPLEPAPVEEGDVPPIPQVVGSPIQEPVMPADLNLSDVFGGCERVLAVVGESPPPFARRWLVQLSQQVPVVASPLASFEGAIRTYGLLARHPSREALAPDGVIQVGHLPLDRAWLAWMGAWTPKVWVQIALDGRWKDPFHRTTHWVPEGLPSSGDVPGGTAYRTRWKESDRRLASWLDRKLEQAEGVWAGLRRILRILPRGAWVHIGASLPIRDLEWVAGTVPDLPRMWMNRGLNGIDGLVSTAMGEAMGAGPGVLWLGDMAFFHDVGALFDLVRLRLPLLVVVVNNQGGRIFEELPIREFPEVMVPYLITPHEISVASVASAFGLPSREVRRVDELLDGVEDLWGDLPAVIEFAVDPDEERTRREAMERELAEVDLP